MTGRWLLGAALAAGLSVAPALAVREGRGVEAGRAVHHALAPRAAGALRDEVPGIRPELIVASTREVRGLAVCGSDLWVATRGGLERYAREVPMRSRRALYGVSEGLDTTDIHRVTCGAAHPIVTTAAGTCTEQDGADGRFTCTPSALAPPDVPLAATLRGMLVTARVAVGPGAGEVVGTPSDGVFWVPASGEPQRLGPVTSPPSSFVRSLVPFAGRLLLGTFNDGMYEVSATADEVAREPRKLEDAVRLATPFRMVNETVEARGVLYVAANEGLFSSTDGRRFERVAQIDVRAVTGLSVFGGYLYATTTSALWRLPLAATRVPAGGQRRSVPSWWRPAGSRSLQGVVADATGVWMASEDRGVIRFDGATFTALDRLAGLPTSWVLAITADGHGGVYAATLRDGALHVGKDGHWEALTGLPSAWTLGIGHANGRVCVGTQEGAACYDDPGAAPGATLRLLGLPDPRVHAVFATGGGMLAATEGGLAAYGGTGPSAPVATHL